MPKDVATIKRFFIVIQSAVFIAGLSLCVLFIYFNYIQKDTETWLKGLDKTAHLIVNHLKVKNELIQGNDGLDYLVYVINQKDGSYVFEEGSRSFDEERLWERYRTKLIYEMQKQKRGWIFYPEKSLWQFNQDQRVIRYLSVDEQGWIVALETHKKNNSSLIKEFLSSGFLFLVFVIVIGGVSIFWLMTNANFKVLQKLISDSIESSFLNLSNEDLFSGGLKPGKELLLDKSAKEPATLEPLEMPMQQPLETTQASSNLLKDSLLEEPPKSPFPMPSHDEPDPLPAGQNQNQPSYALPDPKMEKKAVDNPKPDSFNDMTINLQNIQSPVLKKMITDFRNNKNSRK